MQNISAPKGAKIAWTKATNGIHCALTILKFLCLLITFLVALINVIVMIISLSTFDSGKKKMLKEFDLEKDNF